MGLGHSKKNLAEQSDLEILPDIKKILLFKKLSDARLEILGRELRSFDPGLGALLPTGCTESPGIRIICWS